MWHCFLADEVSDTSGISKWKCRCSSFEGNQSYSLANCSKSCDCHSGMLLEVLFYVKLGDSDHSLNIITIYDNNCFAFDVEGASIWTCICDPNGFPQVAEDGHSPKCFHACNCTWGILLFLSFALILNFNIKSYHNYGFLKKV